MRPKLVIWGAAGHAMVVADIVRLENRYQLAGLLDDVNPKRAGSKVDGLTILGGAEQLELLKKQGITHLIFGFGDCQGRLRLATIAKQKGFELATAIHPRAVVAASAQLGAGTVIVAGAVVNPGTRIGENVIINTGATVDHETAIHDGAHVGPGAHLGGLVTVGEGAWVGIGAIVRDRIRIGAHSIVGAGAVVVKDVPERVVAYGVPAKVMRKLER